MCKTGHRIQQFLRDETHVFKNIPTDLPISILAQLSY